MIWKPAKNIPEIPEPSDPALLQVDTPEELELPDPVKESTIKKERPKALNGKPDHLKTVLQILGMTFIGAVLVMLKFSGNR